VEVEGEDLAEAEVEDFAEVEGVDLAEVEGEGLVVLDKIVVEDIQVIEAMVVVVVDIRVIEAVADQALFVDLGGHQEVEVVAPDYLEVEVVVVAPDGLVKNKKEGKDY